MIRHRKVRRDRWVGPAPGVVAGLLLALLAPPSSAGASAQVRHLLFEIRRSEAPEVVAAASVLAESGALERIVRAVLGETGRASSAPPEEASGHPPPDTSEVMRRVTTVAERFMDAHWRGIPRRLGRVYRRNGHPSWAWFVRYAFDVRPAVEKVIQVDTRRWEAREVS